MSTHHTEIRTSDHVIASDRQALADAQRSFETLAAIVDAEMRNEASSDTIRLVIDGVTTTTRTIGATDLWTASGWKYLQQVHAHHALPGVVDVEDTGGGIYVPVVRLDGGSHIIAIVDGYSPEGEPRYSVGFETKASWDERIGDYLRTDDGLDMPSVIDFIREAAAEVARGERDAQPLPDDFPLERELAAAVADLAPQVHTAPWPPYLTLPAPGDRVLVAQILDRESQPTYDLGTVPRTEWEEGEPPMTGEVYRALDEAVAAIRAIAGGVARRL